MYTEVSIDMLCNSRIVDAFNAVDEIPRIFAKGKHAIEAQNKKKFISWANEQIFDIELRYLCKRILKIILGE